LFAFLTAVYLANGAYLLTGDGVSNVFTVVSLLEDDDFEFDPLEAPMIFEWKVEAEGRCSPVALTQVDEPIRELIESGKLKVARHNLSISTPTVRPGRYVSSFTPGASVVALPAYALVNAWGGDVRRRPDRLWYTGKVVAAACVAGAAVGVYWTVLAFGSTFHAAACSLVYGLATAAWTTGSQGLFQHGPNQFFLSLGVLFFVRSESDPRWAKWSGFSLAAATCCRPTSALAVAAVAAHLLIRDRRRLLAFTAAGLPLAMLLGWYNYAHLGSPLRFGQTSLHELAIEKTGSPEVFSTPVWYGLLGLLISPSRGLFVFSPVLVFSFVGMVVAFRDRSLAVLRPVAVAVVAVLLVESKHFDWWSGWAYGYRHIADLTPLLAVLIAPVLARLEGRGFWKGVFVAATAYSVAVQVLGAFTYDALGWNRRAAYWVEGGGAASDRRTFDPAEAQAWAAETGGSVRIEYWDVDDPRFRGRLWSLRDSEILYYATDVAERRRQQRRMSDFFVQPLERQLADDYARIAVALEEVGDVESAKAWSQRAKRDESNRAAK
jgi:hypothetical protein